MRKEISTITIILITAVYVIINAPIYAEDITPTENNTMPERIVTKSQREVAIQQQLQKIRDEKKRAIIMKIDTRITEINKSATIKLQLALEALSDRLDQIQAYVNGHKKADVSTQDFDNAIQNARKAIAAAQAAVTSQSEKTYTPLIENDTALKATIGLTVSQFRLDLKSIFAKVHNAQEMVTKARVEALKIVIKPLPSKTVINRVSPTP